MRKRGSEVGNSLIRSPLTAHLYSDEDERLKAAEQRLIATGSQVNVAEPWLIAAEQQVNCDDSQVKSCLAAVKGDGLELNQSQGDDSPATPLRLTAAKLLTAHPLTAHRSPL